VPRQYDSLRPEAQDVGARMSRDFPWMKFDPVRFRDEPKLKKCCRQARSLYVDLLALMHHARPYGHVLLDGAPQSAADLAAIHGDAEADVAAWLAQLVAHGVLQRTEEGALFCPRMVRDWAKAERDRANGALGGNPNAATPSEVQRAAMRNAVDRANAADRQRRARERKRKARCAAENSHAPVTPAIRNESRDGRDGSRDAWRDEQAQKPSRSRRVTGLTPGAPLREENLRGLDNLEPSAPTFPEGAGMGEHETAAAPAPSTVTWLAPEAREALEREAAKQRTPKAPALPWGPHDALNRNANPRPIRAPSESDDAFAARCRAGAA
jgi:hypothetical protein